MYVSNRVHQIRTLLPDCRWRHVDSANNPADCPSRGIMPAALAQHKLYWHGPQLAHSDPSEWDDALSPLPLCDLPELRPVSCAARVDEIEVEWFNRFSSYDRMLRVVAYMRRFIAAGIRRVRRQPDHIAPACMQKSELDSAARILEAESQRERSKWTKGLPNVKVDDMVVVVDNQSPPLRWRLGRIVELFPGTDGHVRVARVLTQAGSVVRPVVKLVLLPTK
ncbi:hypothetical protein AGLY_016678 [Aphis glycines]|uniref:DUF5641 domain-containing protein n=1 Tax=Aphis glycines TaxID=307491 RepID=A0A6G0SX70_APHGL|nr:hypothetical protein AGLY_016678 [Aphis glycines]